MNNTNCNIKKQIIIITNSIEKNNNKLNIYNKFMDELITNFHLLNLKFFNLDSNE
jgi:hypothetical protein